MPRFSAPRLHAYAAEIIRLAGNMHILNGMLSIIINPAMLGGADSFAEEVETFLPWIRQSRPIAGEILFPGEPEQRWKAARSVEGIEVDEETWRQLAEARNSLAITQPA